MDVEKIIVSISKIVTAFTDGMITESNLNRILELDPSSVDYEKYENQSIRFSCVLKIIELLLRIRDMPSLELSTVQCNNLKKCIYFLIKCSFVPYLIPIVWNSFESKLKNTIPFNDDVAPNTRYEELKFTVYSFSELIKEPNFKTIIMAKYANVLLAGLCQLSLLPIVKPSTQMARESNINEEKYEQLIREQNAFKNIIKEYVLIDRNPLVIREIIFLIGNKDCQKHLRRGVQHLFNNLLLHPNGIQSILRIACDLTAENSQNFCENGTEEWSDVIHNVYVKSKPQYIKHVIPQIWGLLRAKTIQHQLQYRSVAVCCIHLMCEENYNDFLAFYIHPIDVAINQSKLHNNQVVIVSQCIEDLHTLFYLFKDTIWRISPKLLRYSATIIYNIYMATVNSIYYLRSQLEDLVFMILLKFSNCKDHLKLIIFSPYQMDVLYDDYGNIQIKYVEKEHQLSLEYQADLVIKLMKKRPNRKLMEKLFITVLNMYADTLVNEYTLLEKLFIVKCIYYLIEQNDAQKSLFKDHPEIVLNVIKSILKEIIEQQLNDEELLSVAIMILRCILDNHKNAYIDKLNDFLDYLPKIAEIVENEDLKLMLNNIEHEINRIRCTTNSLTIVRFQRTIDDVLKKVRDPLLPCRAHALIELKKMIESGDSTVLAQKSVVLVAIQENLKNADSYLYLSAIFTLSALCSSCPNDLLPILCDEYSMPKTYNYSSETRLKIGEALMKTIRLLNETIPVHKNRLLNTFMAGVRDDDNLVRASSLSNLAELCRLLRFNLGSIIAEVVNCADYVLRFDPAVEPRRAAALLLQLIIEGADLKLLEILQDNITNIYKMLKYRRQCDKDVTIKIHAQVAIERLDEIMKELLLD